MKLAITPFGPQVVGREPQTGSKDALLSAPVSASVAMSSRPMCPDCSHPEHLHFNGMCGQMHCHCRRDFTEVSQEPDAASAKSRARLETEGA